MAISVDEPADSLQMARELGINFPLLWDPELEVAGDYGVAMKDKDIAVPSVFVISRTRRIVWRQVGETPLDRADLDDVLAALGKARR